MTKHHYPRTAIGDLVAPVETWNPQRSAPNLEFDYIDIASIDRESKTIIQTARVKAATAPSRARQIVRANDVLVSTVRPNLNAVAIVSDELDGATASTGYCVLRPMPDRVHHRYLFHWVRAPEFIGEMTRLATGANYPAVTDRIVCQSTIPLPPLSEQIRIAAILDQADVIRRKRREGMNLVLGLKGSLFLEMFGDPMLNPKRWPRCSFGDRLTLLEYGPRFHNEAYTPSGVRIVRITDLDFQGNLDFDAMPTLDVVEEDRERYRLLPGDLLLARSGATVGKTALIPDGAPPCIAGAYFIRMRFSDDVHPLYAQMIFRSPSIQCLIAEKSRQSAQQNFNGPAIRSLPLPLAPRPLQDAFASHFGQLQGLAHRLKEHERTTAELFDSVLNRAFRGRL